MTNEHFFPRWLLDYAPANVDSDMRWIGDKRVALDKAKIPLCRECNETLGRALEAPVADIFRVIDRGESLSDQDCELLVRWLWKFEGFAWHLQHATEPDWTYSRNYSLVERVTTSVPFEDVRPEMVLAVSRIEANDPGKTDWPVGLDMPASDWNALCMSGVFGRVAIIASLAEFARLIPTEFGLFRFASVVADKTKKTFVPPVGFKTATDAIAATLGASLPLLELHEAWARRQLSRRDQGLIRVRPRVELPPV